MKTMQLKILKDFPVIVLIIIGSCICDCLRSEIVAGKNEAMFSLEEMKNIENLTEEKWYDLPINKKERAEAEKDCKLLMELYHDDYEAADKGTASNVILEEETLLSLQKIVKDNGYSVTTSAAYSNMDHYESVDSFLRACTEGKKGTTVIYELNYDGGLSRKKFIFDGSSMYVLSTKGSWNNNDLPVISYMSYEKIKNWKYSEKGWLCYEVFVPEPPEVSERMNGSCLIRVKPITEEQREMSKRCVWGIGYQGNNLLCSDWNTEKMDELDYNGIFEYLYRMEYGERFQFDDYTDGIPKEIFESVIMKYLPVTPEQLQKYAVFNDENQSYAWEKLGCFNYCPTYFGTSLPEVVNIRENADGTVTLTVDAVCSMIICDDAVITHELTVSFTEDGSFRYLGNRILNDGISDIPSYQYRIRK